MSKKFHRIIVLGQTGDGKSTLCNYILGEKMCEVVEDWRRRRSEIVVYTSVKKKNDDIIMVDTPGLSDSDGDDQAIIDKIRKELRDNHCDGIKSIIIMHNYNFPRFSAESQRLLSIYCKMFPIPDFWQHVGIVFSRTYEFFPNFEQLKEQKFKDFMPDFEKRINKIIDETNANLPSEKAIQKPGHIQTFFTDCADIIDGNRTDKEIDDLIDWTRGLDYLDIDKNDLEGRVFANCKEKKQIEDLIDPKEEETDDKNKKKVTEKHYRKYNIIDFSNNQSVYTEEKPYKEEIFYYKTEIWDKKILKAASDLEGDNYCDNFTIQYYSRIDKYDKNMNLLEKGKENKGNSKERLQVKQKIYTEEEDPNPNITTDEITETKYFDSDSALSDYYKELSSMSTGGKVTYVVGNILSLGIVHLVGTVIQFFKKKRRWKQVITIKRKIQEKRKIKTDNLGKKYPQKWEFDKVIEILETIYSKPVQI